MAPLCHPNARFAFQAHRALARACRPFTSSRTAPQLAPGLAVTRAAKSPSQPAKPLYQPTSARDAIETATRVFKEEQDLDEAIRLYRASMQMAPSEDEARAALYNLGCALAKQKKWSEATASIVTAINDYKLKLYVALKQPCLTRHVPPLHPRTSLDATCHRTCPPRATCHPPAARLIRHLRAQPSTLYLIP
ncbi:hypothetical protein TSOC_014094 [Tetrabaena socialis]|uniref:Uncharacterized protein n=1 Tax=Tetrabaena socialis TaxID=47790 RepID=A0A2J7ZIM1_9CHLO|nr:hypothetical protein TSOC_014094 [Tetrabaena socialis]|eukprot:PNH00100.1 hypothetical protein TSOC_014094 [Tetrabaena socialis]